MKTIHILNTAGARSLYVSLAGAVQNIKGLFVIAKIQNRKQTSLSETLFLEYFWTCLFKAKKLVEQIMDQTDEINSNKSRAPHV